MPKEMWSAKGKTVGYDWDNDLAEAINAAATKGMLISNHSYGIYCFCTT